MKLIVVGGLCLFLTVLCINHVHAEEDEIDEADIDISQYLDKIDESTGEDGFLNVPPTESEGAELTAMLLKLKEQLLVMQSAMLAKQAAEEEEKKRKAALGIEDEDEETTKEEATVEEDDEDKVKEDSDDDDADDDEADDGVKDEL